MKTTTHLQWLAAGDAGGHHPTACPPCRLRPTRSPPHASARLLTRYAAHPPKARDRSNSADSRASEYGLGEWVDRAGPRLPRSESVSRVRPVAAGSRESCRDGSVELPWRGTPRS